MWAWAVIFWGSAFIVGWTYAGYALWLHLRARRFAGSARCLKKQVAALPCVSIVISVRNDPERLRAKLKHLLSLCSPHVLEIIVVCDHCTDETPQVAADFSGDGVRTIFYDEEPAGKAGALNVGLASARADLVLFNDVRQTLRQDAIDRLAEWFSDEDTGAVSGSLDIATADDGAGKGIDAYWSLEKRIRHWESQIDSSIGCTGAIYMIRRALYEPLPPDTILDDVVVPMSIAVKGCRVRFDPEAKAYDPQQLTTQNESRRKTRTLAGNFQMLFRHPSWLLPWRNRLWWQLISHKYLRILSPVFITAALVSCVPLAASPFYALALVLALIFIALALLGLAVPQLKAKIVTLPAAFLLLQIFVVRGFFEWLRIAVRGHSGWK